MPFPPQAFIIGAQKSGTTFLANLLDQHENVCVSHPKETNFFTQNWGEGTGWYKSCFDNHDAQLLIDASPSYSVAPLPGFSDSNEDLPQRAKGVPEKIRQLSPDSKFIYIIREPAKRTYSSYWHSVRGGYESRPFRVAIKRQSLYLRASHYYDQLMEYTSFFPAENFLIILFEDLIQSPRETLGQCCEFLELEQMENLMLDAGKNRSFQYAPFLSYINRKLQNVGGLNQFVKVVKPVVPDMLVKLVSSHVTSDIPKISEEDER